MVSKKQCWQGPGTLQDILCGVSVSLSPHSFYQVNHDAAEQLYREAAQLAALQPNETLLDLYCGAGTIGLSMVQPGQKLIGVEVVHSAVENARQNAARAGVTDAEFLCADAGKASQILAERGLRLMSSCWTHPARAAITIPCKR